MPIGINIHRWPQVDERPTPATPLTVDESAWWPHRAAVGAALALGAAVAMAGSFGQQDPSPAQTSIGGGVVSKHGARIVRWYQADDWVPPADAQALDDGAAWNPTVVAQTPPRVMLWRVDDDRPTPAVFTPVSDDSPPLPRATNDANVIVWAENEEIVPQAAPLPIDEAYWQQPRHPAIAPNLRVWATTDEVVQAAVPLPVDDAPWQVFTPRWPAPIVSFWRLGDERPTPPIPLPVDDIPWQVWTPARVPPRVTVWTLDDQITTPPEPGNAREYRRFSSPIATSRVLASPIARSRTLASHIDIEAD